VGVDSSYNKLIITNFEMTGIYANVHEIIEIGAICCDAKSLEILWEFETKIKPRNLDRAGHSRRDCPTNKQVIWGSATELLDGAFNRSVFFQGVCYPDKLADEIDNDGDTKSCRVIPKRV
jgi:hypothetical protein